MSRRIDRVGLFAALGDPTRLRIVNELAPGHRRSIAELTTGSRLTRQAIAKHLRVLEGAGWLRGERVGREVRYELQTRTLTEAQSYLAGVAAQWEAALGRLKTFVERGQVSTRDKSARSSASTMHGADLSRVET